MTIKLFDWLMMTDTLGISTIIIYQYDDDDCPIYTGWTHDVPYWVADLYIAKDCGEEFEEPISFRTSLGDDYQNKPGWVIVVTDNEDEAYKLKGGE